MSTYKLDLVGVPGDQALAALKASAESFAAFPDAEVTITLTAYAASEMFASDIYESLARDIKQTTTEPEDPDIGDEPEEPEIPPVKRRSKEEIAAGLDVDQAARFRASGEKSPADWLDAVDEEPGSPPETKAEEVDDDDEEDEDIDLDELDDEEDEDDEDEATFENAKDLALEIRNTQSPQALKKIFAGHGVKKFAEVPADILPALYRDLKKALDKK